MAGSHQGFSWLPWELGIYSKDSGKVLDSFEQRYLYLIPILFCRFLWRVQLMGATRLGREGLRQQS